MAEIAPPIPQVSDYNPSDRPSYIASLDAGVRTINDLFDANTTEMTPRWLAIAVEYKQRTHSELGLLKRRRMALAEALVDHDVDLVGATIITPLTPIVENIGTAHFYCVGPAEVHEISHVYGNIKSSDITLNPELTPAMFKDPDYLRSLREISRPEGAAALHVDNPSTTLDMKLIELYSVAVLTDAPIIEETDSEVGYEPLSSNPTVLKMLRHALRVLHQNK